MRVHPPRWRAPPDWPLPPLRAALARGAANRCPCCGRGALFCGFLRPVERCLACAAPIGRIRADDAPPYVTIFLVGHLVVPLILAVERAFAPPLWAMAALFLPVALGLALLLLRPVKGATVGLMLALGITGREHGPDGAG